MCVLARHCILLPICGFESGISPAALCIAAVFRRIVSSCFAGPTIASTRPPRSASVSALISLSATPESRSSPGISQVDGETTRASLILRCAPVHDRRTTRVGAYWTCSLTAWGCNVVGLRWFERLQGIRSSLCFRVLESGAAEPLLTACEREEGFSARWFRSLRL